MAGDKSAQEKAAAERAERLARALRDNLKRRKAQARAREGEAPAEGGPARPERERGDE